MAQALHMSRVDDAERIARLLSPDPLMGSISGLFLAAPRRTGKTTFLRSDLIPLLEERGFVVAYADLWEDKTRDPADVIVSAIRDAMQRNEGVVARLRRRNPVDALGVLGVSVGLKDGGRWEGTLSQAAQLLVEATGSDLVLIVDEAQQALETQAGMDAMLALKAARDAVNLGTDRRLYLVMTGSHRDKLATLVSNQQAPFFGAMLRDFPPLGHGYATLVTAHVNASLAEKAQLAVEDVATAFTRLDHRPELLLSCLREMLLAPEGAGPDSLRRLTGQMRDRMVGDLRAEIEDLSEIQRRLLSAMARGGDDFQPFAEATRTRLMSDAGRVPSVTMVQKALDALRSKGFVWRQGHGRYVLNGTDVAAALAELG